LLSLVFFLMLIQAELMKEHLKHLLS